MAKKLKELGHKVEFPPVNFVDGNGKEWHTLEYYSHKKSKIQPVSNHPDDDQFWDNHTQRIKDHFDCVTWCDCVLVLNYDKNDIKNYIGPNTLMEMGLAFYLKKKIYLLNPIPEVAWTEEILGLRPIVIKGDLSKIA